MNQVGFHKNGYEKEVSKMSFSEFLKVLKDEGFKEGYYAKHHFDGYSSPKEEAIYYMKEKGLIIYTTSDFSHFTVYGQVKLVKNCECNPKASICDTTRYRGKIHTRTRIHFKLLFS